MAQRSQGGGEGFFCCITLLVILCLVIMGCIFGAWHCTMQSEDKPCKTLWDLIQLFGIMSGVSIFFACCCGCCTGMEEESKREQKKPESHWTRETRLAKERKERQERMREVERLQLVHRKQIDDFLASGGKPDALNPYQRELYKRGCPIEGRVTRLKSETQFREPIKEETYGEFVKRTKKESEAKSVMRVENLVEGVLQLSLT